MNFSNFKQVATRSIGRSGLILKKYSPEILTGVGVVTGISAGVLAVRATLKAEPVLDRIRSDIQGVKELRDAGKLDNPQEYGRTLGIVYGLGAIELGRLYGPSITLGLASVSCVIGAHGIMRKRNAALVVAYNAIEKSFSEYRSRVVDAIGEEKELVIRRGILQEEVTDEETGKKKIVSTFDPNGVSAYAKFFDEYNAQWSKTPEYNLMFLKNQQNWANDQLHARGHLFLNEVYEALSIPHTKAGAVCGWVVSGDGDNFVDFGMYDVESDAAREFINGYERSILLDFNVDGVIYDKI